MSAAVTAAAITRSKIWDWRRGQESNLPRHLRGGDGFEDREGHQAPFTLRKEKTETVQRSTLKVQRRATEEEAKERLLEFLDVAHNGVEVRPIAGIEFGMEKFSIGANLKCSAARRNESERLDTLSEFENFGRQTDGLGCVVSNHAVFDRYFGFHLLLLSEKRLRRRRETVKPRSNVPEASHYSGGHRPTAAAEIS